MTMDVGLATNEQLRAATPQPLPPKSPTSPAPTASEATSSDQCIIIIGGGLAGLSAAHAALEAGGRVVLLDKKPRLGGNSIKASSGINGVPTPAQAAHKIPDTVESFVKDTTASAAHLARPDLIETLASSSADALHWLQQKFGLDLSVVVRLGGHSFPRSHRPEGGPPGWLITTTLAKALEAEAEEVGGRSRVRIRSNSRVTDVFETREGSIAGVEVEDTVSGSRKKIFGKVIVASGGFSTDVDKKGLITKHRPDLLSLPTTSGDHTTGDLHHILSKKAALVDMEEVQIHPTGFLDPNDIHARSKVLAAEALRGVGGILVDARGQRFVNELGRRDYVTSRIQTVLNSSFGPVRMLLNEDAFAQVAEHGAFYVKRGLMTRHDNLATLARDTGMLPTTLAASLTLYETSAAEGHDEFGKIYFSNAQFVSNRPVYSALITPVIHYCMGGLSVNSRGQVLNKQNEVVPNLFAAGEAAGGVHGCNRLGGSSLLECVVYGRLAARSAMDNLQENATMAT